MNPEMLDKLTKVIAKNPDRFDMAEWQAGCGTTCCIAGWALVFAGYKPSQFMLGFSDLGNNEDIFQTATEVLGISQDQAERLFTLYLWPQDIRDRYRSGDKTAAIDMLNLIAAESQPAEDINEPDPDGGGSPFLGREEIMSDWRQKR